VVFITLEDETGSVNVIIWRKLFEQFRRAVTSARLMRVTGTVQRANGVPHIIAQHIEDISDMLDHLVTPVEPLSTAPKTRYD
jgi:DNA-directed RNA polymerase